MGNIVQKEYRLWYIDLTEKIKKCTEVKSTSGKEAREKFQNDNPTCKVTSVWLSYK